VQTARRYIAMTKNDQKYRANQNCENFALPSRYAVLSLLISVYATLSSQRRVPWNSGCEAKTIVSRLSCQQV
jgi:hypothetical protein